jgi:hypothetical protein
VYLRLHPGSESGRPDGPHVTGGLGDHPASLLPRSGAREVACGPVCQASDAGIPYVEVRLADEDMSEDGLHPNDKGYQVMAERLRSLGYEPLYPAKRIARGLPAPK